MHLIRTIQKKIVVYTRPQALKVEVHTPESFMFTPFPQHEFFDFSGRRIIISGAIKVLSCWENVSIFFLLPQ